MKIFILKLGALGDVVRTTPILKVLKGDITWFTKEKPAELLKGLIEISNLITNIDEIKDKKFDLAVNFDDTEEACSLFNQVDAKKKIGFYFENGYLTCSKSAREYYAMSLNGGKDKDLLKKNNKKSYQEFIFEIVGKKFKGEKPLINITPEKGTFIGLEPTASSRWPLKKWDKYNELKIKLEKAGFKVIVFKEHKTLKEYAEEINKCNIIVCNDSLALHIASALNKKVIAFFGPTPAAEIYDYNLIKKIETPLDCKVCMKNSCDKNPNCMNIISLEQVYNEVRRMIQ